MIHPALSSGNVAVVTGGASGIGLAAAERFAAMGLKVALADLPGERLDAAAHALTRAGGEALAVPTDVSSRDDLRRLETTVLDRFGQIHVLMNNAGVQPGSSLFDGAAAWEQVLAVNLWGPDPRRAGLRPRDDRARPARPGDQHRLQAGHHHAAGRPRLQRVQGRREGADRGPGARAAQRARVQAHRPPPDPGLRLHPAHRQGPGREAGRRLDARADGRLHAAKPGPRRLLHPLPRQRRAAPARRAADPVGRPGHHRQPPTLVALAPGLGGALQGVAAGRPERKLRCPTSTRTWRRSCG